MITLSWTAPSQPNGVIRNYTVFYHHSEDPLNTHNETFGPDVFSYTVDVLGGVTYWFNVRAETIKPGENASLIVNISQNTVSAMQSVLRISSMLTRSKIFITELYRYI